MTRRYALFLQLLYLKIHFYISHQQERMEVEKATDSDDEVVVTGSSNGDRHPLWQDPGALSLSLLSRRKK